MILEIHPDAADEAAEAALFYHDRDHELSLRFRMAVYNAIEQLCSQPLLHRDFGAGLRKSKVNRFPYFVIYRLTGKDSLQVLALAHTSREPAYWKDRL
jgi:plasmid stabilization system protein ParE